MSFILDALKKSEERRILRDQRHAPRQTVLDVSWSGSRRWSVWLLLFVLLIALGCGWWLRGVSLQPAPPGQAGTSSPPTPGGPVAQPTRAAATAAPAAVPAPPRTGDDRFAPFAPVPVDAGVTVGQPVPETTTEGNTGSAVTVDRPQRAPSAPAAPAARQDRLPKLTMSLHFYTVDPAQRMVRIDNRIVREGQALSKDLVLEEITPGGAIFSIAGDRFEVRRPGGQP